MTAEAVQKRRPRQGWLLPAAWVVVTALFLLAPSLGLINLPWMRQIILVALLALIVSGLNLSFGFAGELSFASAAMYAAGAYATGYLAMNVVNDLALAILVSSLFGLLLGLISGIPGLRLGGWMLATSSFFLVLLVPDIVDIFRDALGGHQGMTGIPRAQLFGFELGDTGLYLAVIVVTSFWFILYRNLVVSRSGNALAVLRQSPILASSLGISVYGLKLKAYALAGLPAAIAGAFFAYLDGFIAPDNFGMNFTIAILAAAILGGKRSIYGVFLGAAIMQLGPMRTSLFGDFAFIAYGVLLVIVGVLLPGGIAGGIAELRSRIRGRRSTRETSRRARAAADKPSFGPLPGKRLAVTGVGKTFGGVAALTWWDGHPVWDTWGKQSLGYSFLVLAASGVLVSASARAPESWWVRAFSASWLRRVGRYSYCLYLIHLPVMWTMKELVFDPTRAPRLAGSAMPAQVFFWFVALAPALALASASWRWFEAPILRLKRFFPY